MLAGQRRRKRRLDAAISRNGPICAWLFAEFVNQAARNRNHATGVWNDVMNTDNGFFGLIVGGIVALAAAIFIFSGGEFGGKKTVEGDQDLPPIATADRDQ
jgi:hypothetical protein